MLLSAAAITLLAASSTASFVLLPAAPDKAVPTASAAAVDYFLKIDGIEGESRDKNNKNSIDIESFSWGATNTASVGGGGGGSGKASFQDISVTKIEDRSSPPLFLAVPTGTHYKTASIVGRRADGTEFTMLTLSDVMITSFAQTGISPDGPTESLSLNFAKIEFQYKPTGQDGKAGAPVKAGWDLKENKKA